MKGIDLVNLVVLEELQRLERRFLKEAKTLYGYDTLKLKECMYKKRYEYWLNTIWN